MKTKTKASIIILALLLISLGGVAISIEPKQKDIPSPLNPTYLKKITDCGKIDLIDRTSKNYNPKALIDGSLKECNK